MAPRRGRAKFLAKELAPERRLEIADIGARLINAAPPYQDLLDLGLANLTAFEPDPEAFAALEKHFDGQPHMRAVQAAVGQPGKSPFYAHKIGSLSSIFRIRPEAAKYLGKEFWTKREVKELRVDLLALDAVEGIEALDVLKMDVQGAERDVMRFGRKTLKDAVAIIPEVRFYQMYQGEPMWADLDQELRAQGFVLHKFLHQKTVAVGSSFSQDFERAGASQLLDGDAVYIPSLEKIDSIDSAKLARLAIAADAVFSSCDLAAACLDVLAARGDCDKTVPNQYFEKIPPQLRKVMEGAQL